MAAFFLFAIISVRLIKSDRRFIIPAIVFAGCSAWTKNEGIVLALLFIVFNYRVFFSKGHLLLTLSGGLFPILTLCVFKIFYAPGNDLILSSQHAWESFTDGARYETVVKKNLSFPG